MSRSVVAFVVSLFAVSLAAQSPAYLVRDINVSVAPDTTSSSPVNFVRLGSRIVFAATTREAGAELWITDGTPGGTSMVKDLAPGAESSYPKNFVPLNGLLLFTARDARGEELWSTDGTAKGTRLIADICAGSCSSSPIPLFVHGNELLFSADNRINGSELWITDGTPVGTRLFKDLVPGPLTSAPGNFTVLDGVIYFGTSNALWKTDGTPDGTIIVKEQPVYSLRASASRLFFTSSVAGSGEEPWVSDGTGAGTRMIRDIRPGDGSSVNSEVTIFGDRALFTAKDGVHGTEPWITDGTEAGTFMLRDINPGSPSGGPFQFSPFAVVGGVAYFSATDANGAELWRTDGTEAGTFMVRDVVPGKDGSNPTALTAMGGRVFFLANAGPQQNLWVTDGTAAGTRPVRTSDAPNVSIANNDPNATFNPAPLTAIDGTVYFGGRTLANGLEPWKSDGTQAGTTMIANIGSDAAANSNPDGLVAAGDLLFFRAWDGTGTVTAANDGPRSFWRTDGTAAGTIELLPAASESTIAAGRSVFFKGSDGQLWRSDGTPGGTGPASELAQRFPGAPAVVYATGDTLFVDVVRNGQSELWVAAGAPNAPATPLGTSSGTKFTEFAGRTIFANDAGIWITDRAPGGTHLMLPFLAAKPPDPPTTLEGPMAVMGGSVYFALRTPAGFNLWKSDGTVEGSVIVRPLPAGIDAMLSTGRRLFFVCNGSLWTSDGSETRSLTIIEPTSTFFASLGDRVVFSSKRLARTDPGNVPQPEPWISDGTDEGTRELRDIVPGAAGSKPDDFLSVDGVVYFTAADAASGRELWSTDGTPEGTTLVADVEPGPKSSSPGQLRRAGNRLFFVATTAAAGVELWAVPLSAAPSVSIGDTRAGEREGGSTARFVVALNPASAQTVKVDFGTSDGTAVAGADYDATSGTLVFAPGETSKTIDVAVRDDALTEINESFFVTLGHAEGAAISRPTAFAVIEDNEERMADLSASFDLSQWNLFHLIVDAANSGPWPATEIKVARTSTPVEPDSADGPSCLAIIQLAPGSSAGAYDQRSAFYQQYNTATLSARQRDPQLSNNTVAWMTNFGMGMDAVYLTPGEEATAWAYVPSNLATLSVESSSPAVISVPSSIANASSGPPKFTVRGVGVGKATVRVFSGTLTFQSIDVEVVAAGAKPRFPGGMATRNKTTTVRFDQPAVFDVFSNAKAPFSGATATGVVTVSIGDHQVGRVTLAPGETRRTFSTYLRARGSNQVRFDYAGDANFLPQTTSHTLTATQGAATILGSGARSGNDVVVHVRVAGSPSVAPSGTIYATVLGTGKVSQTMTLPTGAAGDAQADLTIENLEPAWQAVTVFYSGDADYAASFQSVGIRDTRGRAAGHH